MLLTLPMFPISLVLHAPLYEGLVADIPDVASFSHCFNPLSLAYEGLNLFQAPRFSLEPSIRHCHPFGTTCHSELLQNSSTSPYWAVAPLGPLWPPLGAWAFGDGVGGWTWVGGGGWVWVG